MQSEEVIHRNVCNEEEVSSGLRYSPFIFVTLVLMAVALVYVWSHIRMTELEYTVAEEMSIKEKLLEEQTKLKVEIATLKSPQRLEAITKEKLQMTYPTRDQFVILNSDDLLKSEVPPSQDGTSRQDR
jgi:cell division protein FtsL